MINHTFKLLVDNDLDKLFIESLKEYSRHTGERCDKCGIIQGKPHLGWKRYYCSCFGQRIDRKFSKREKELFRDIIKCLVDELHEKEGVK